MTKERAQKMTLDEFVKELEERSKIELEKGRGEWGISEFSGRLRFRGRYGRECPICFVANRTPRLYWHVGKRYSTGDIAEAGEFLNLDVKVKKSIARASDSLELSGVDWITRTKLRRVLEI